MNHTIQDVIYQIKEYDPNADSKLILKAYDYAESKHEGQFRKSGEPYIIHPVEVAYILCELKMDMATIISALLHDVVEDTDSTYNDVQEMFGKDIADIVDGVTKMTKLEYYSSEDAQIETFRKMFIAMAKDLRVIIVKLADRLHNMRTLDSMPRHKQIQKSQETLDIYAPIAHRLGMAAIKMEFEDLALKYLEPEIYEKLVESIDMKRSESEAYIDNVKNVLLNKLFEQGINVESIKGRPKHYYSIYKKMKSGKTLDEIYDIIAIRVIVQSVSDCYATLGWAHTLWKPIPGRIKDYIAIPKPNMYQSLHTTVIGPGGTPFEIQIRTVEMDNTAEFGIAAHWNYKEGKKGIDELGSKLHFLMEIKEFEQENVSNDEFVSSVKQDLYTDEVFIFTPKGKVIELPKGSTPIDFAYRIHSDIGNKCVGAKVKGKIVPINYQLSTGDIVEIITSPQSKGPSRDWLNFVASSSAKSKIRAFLRKANKEENLIKGREMMEREVKHLGMTLKEFAKNEYVDFISKRFNVSSWEDLFSVIGYGGLKPMYVAQRIREHFKNDFPDFNKNDDGIILTKAPKKDKSGTIHVQGNSDFAITFGKCCKPVLGDSIIGFITRNSGITVHRKDCPNIINCEEPDRLIDVGWVDDDPTDGMFTAKLLMNCEDRPKLLSDVSTLVSNEGYNITSVSSRVLHNGTALIEIEIIVKDVYELTDVIRKLENIPNIISVTRM